MIRLLFVLLASFFLFPQSAKSDVAPGFDPSQMSGIPRQDETVEKNTVVVRLIKDNFQNNLPGIPVALVSLPSQTKQRSETTDASGRALFSSLAPGKYQVQAVVDGQLVSSKPIQIEPSLSAGIRVLLVFKKKESVASQSNLAHLYFKEGSFVLVRFQNDQWLEIYEELLLVNPLSIDVDPGESGIKIPLSEHAEFPTVFSREQNHVFFAEGSSNEVPYVLWKGTLSPGEHQIRISFLLQGTNGFFFSQRLSLPFQSPLLMLEDNPYATLQADGFHAPEKIGTLDGGKILFAVAKHDFPAGDTFSFSIRLKKSLWIPIVSGIFSGFVALCFAILFLLSKKKQPMVDEKEALLERREQILSALVSLRENHGNVQNDASEEEINKLMNELTQIYEDLDRKATFL